MQERITMQIAVECKFDRVMVEVGSSVARIALHHGSLNVIEIPMMQELAHALAEVEESADVSVVVLSGEGTTFSAGVDVAAHTPEKIEEMLRKFHAVIHRLIASKKVTIAAVQGHCRGGGAELGMVCDMVYTAASAQWGFPEIKLACYPPVACTALAALVGQKRAAELVLTGRTITGSQAAEMGLATRALPDGALAAAVEGTIQGLVKLSSAALAITKKAIYSWDSMHFDKGLARAEKIYLEELMKTADAREGISAFMEKRAPRWTGE